MRVICHRFEGNLSHLIWQVEGDLSQFCCSLPCILRLLIVFLAVTGSETKIEGNLSQYMRAVCHSKMSAVCHTRFSPLPVSHMT
ncbi:hypothetical protein FOT78_24880 [Klebsiella pneumoniae]|nr:hypothetical protein [Klebsiella pneumoniae]QAX13348.1 hypothetical protein C2M21_26335 [Klebsiella pneumoniae]HBY0997442.1 hypothetical protein [Klebsiella pneumoniae]HBY1512748.1 hypothetical protein [Klebsiella pneumoniae]HBY5265301.1 hypothetical protein [Klebsiella pneumoniae]